MEYDCHIIYKYLAFQMKSLSIKNLGFRLKNSIFQIKNNEILGLSYIKFEILGILSVTPSILET